MGPFEQQVEQLAEAVSHVQTVFNWIVKAMNSFGREGPWKVRDVTKGNSRYDVDGTGLHTLDVEEALEKLAQDGVVELNRLPAGIIDTFTIDYTAAEQFFNRFKSRL